MRKIAVIPARYNASRFPGKLLQCIDKKTVIESTYTNVKKANLFDEVIVATDDKKIYNTMKKIGARVEMTRTDHNSGSDRIAEVVQNIETDIVVNVQGDEPFLNHESLRTLLRIVEDDKLKEVAVASLMEKITEEKEINDPNNVKVVVDNKGNALYFSRAAIPYSRDSEAEVSYYKHIGIYAFRKEALLQFTKLPQGQLEQIEKLEQLRYLENNFKIRLAVTPHATIGIDTREDLEKARRYIANNNIHTH